MKQVKQENLQQKAWPLRHAFFVHKNPQISRLAGAENWWIRHGHKIAKVRRNHF